MVTTSVPPPSSMRRSVELDAVRDVMLLETEEHFRAPPVPRREGPRAVRGEVEGKLGAAIAAEDLMQERSCSLDLARLHFEHDLDLDRAVQLLHRALEIEDDTILREELARQLMAMGRHVEAGHVLRDGEPRDQQAVVETWLRSGDAYARAGDAMEAIATYREVAMLTPDDPRPFERIAAIAFWDPMAVPPARAADALLEAAKRYPPSGTGFGMSLARAFEVAPSYARSAEAYTKLLRQQGRDAEADEAWRVYGTTSLHSRDVALQLAAWAVSREDWIGAITAAVDAVVLADPKQEDRDSALSALLENQALLSGLGKYATDDQPFAAGIVAAARTRSSMGRADAFVKLADRFQSTVRGLLLALAAEAYGAAGSAERARKTALNACAVAPWLPRAHTALLALEEDHELEVAQLENALSQFPARARNYLRIAERLRAEGRHTLALAWARRACDLRRGDREPLEALLSIAVDSGDVALAASTVAHVLGAAQPHPELGDALRRTLESVAEKDLRAALEIGKMVLSAVGPGREPLYLTLRHLASRAGDSDFEVALVLRRAVGDEVEDSARAELYLEATELCLSLGSAEGAAEHCYCAAAHAGPLERLRGMIERVRAAVERLAPEQRSDALLALAHANAWAAEQQDTQTAVEAWRELAALRSDVADDHEGAEEAFFVACAHDHEAGPYRYAGDLTHRFGAEAAVSILVDRAVSIGDEGDDPKLCAKLYAAAARVAADHGLFELAINAAVTAVQVDPARGDAVAVVEKIADGDEGLAALNFVYNTLADTALGRYGYRAAHYRAARQFEKRGAYDHALRHAIMAFEAVPSVGASYQMLLRLAERAGDEGAAVRTLAGVAASFPTDTAFMWMMRAAELAKSFAAGRELTFELLLKAFKLRQSPELVEQLGAAAHTLAEDSGDEEMVHVRLERALRTALPHLEGLRGSQTAVLLGVMAADMLGDPRLAVDSVLRAIELDGPQTDCSAVVPCVDAIAADRDAARELLTHINELRARSKAPLDRSLKEITAQLYLKLSDVPPPPSSRAPSPSGTPGQSDRPANRLTFSSLPPASSTMDSAKPVETPVPPPLDEPEFARLEESTPPQAPIEAVAVEVAPESAPESAPEIAGEIAPDVALEAALAKADAPPVQAATAEAPAEAPKEPEEPEEPDEKPLPLTRRGEDPLPLTRRASAPNDEPEVVTSQEELELDEAILAEEDLLAREAAAKSEVEILSERDSDYELVTEKPPSSGVEQVSASDVEIVAEPITRPPMTPVVPSREDARDAAMLRRALELAAPTDTVAAPDRNAAPTPLPIIERPKEPKAPGEAIELAARSREAAWLAAAEVRGKTDRPIAAAHDIGEDEDWSAIDYSPASEQSARERGDHAAIARMLAARALGTENLEQRRLVRLRRAAVLEQRLDLLDDACAELEAILEECGEDATALRYLADLCDRMERPTRAARLWLRASKQAASLDEKLRDVARCCEALITADRPETAKRLMDAAAGLPQSPRMLKLRIEVARMLDDQQELVQAQTELQALDDDLEPSSPPGDSLHPFDSAPPTKPPPSSSRSSHSDGHALERSVSSRRVFRVGGAVVGGHSPASVLMSCRNAYTERGVGGPRDAKETVRKLRAIADDLPEGDRDLHTFLLVEALDAMQGSAAAMKELQRHWETIGGTPLVTLAVADRLVRRGDLRPALRLYERVMDKDLREVRSSGRVALSAAEVAHRLHNERTAETYLERAALDPDSREAAEQRFAKWFGRYSSRPASDSVPPSGQRPATSPPSSQPGSGPAGLRQVHTEDALGELEIDERGQVAEPEPPPSERLDIPSSPPLTPGSLLRRAPTFPELVAPHEEELFNELIDGSYDAGEALVAQFHRDERDRSHDVLAVRRYQVALRRGDRKTLANLRDAASADGATAFARAIEHVLAAFDPAAFPVAPPPLEKLAPQPEATARLLFGGLNGTINEALALVWETGMSRRDMRDYDFTGTDRVPPVATTPVGRVYGALTRLVDLGGVRLFHRSRSSGPLTSNVALVNPLAAILTGTAEREGPALRYVIGSALAAATPHLALADALEEREARDLVAAMVAGFGPIVEGSTTDASSDQMRIAEDLWHVMPPAADRRLRQLCENRREMTYEAALANTRRTRRRTGLFASGDLVTSMVQTINELDLAVARPIRGEHVLRELCSDPDIADLFDLATVPEFAEARWATI